MPLSESEESPIVRSPTAADDRCETTKHKYEPEDEKYAQTLTVGTRVRITGLVNKPDLNDTFGIVQVQNSNSKRWTVLCDVDGTQKNFLEKNLELVVNFEAGMRVMIKNLVSKPQLNGTYGKLMRKDPANSRWTIICEHDNTTKSFQEKNIVQKVGKDIKRNSTTSATPSRSTSFIYRSSRNSGAKAYERRASADYWDASATTSFAI